MKVKHNKKRNTAFVYEALIREGTTAILKKDFAKRDKVVTLLKKHFPAECLLRQDLECYRSLYESKNLTPIVSEKILKEAKLQKRLINPDHLFKKQTELIKDVNKEISPDVFNNFVPNYKTLASINQMFVPSLSPKNRVILETQVIREMLTPTDGVSDMEHIDDIVYKSIVKKFNEKYDSKLLDEQKALLTHYIASFVDNALELKMFLNEEIGRLKKELTASLDADILKEDEEMGNKTAQLIEQLDSFVTSGVDHKVLVTILKTQNLVKELVDHGDNN